METRSTHEHTHANPHICTNRHTQANTYTQGHTDIIFTKSMAKDHNGFISVKRSHVGQHRRVFMTESETVL